MQTSQVPTWMVLFSSYANRCAFTSCRAFDFPSVSSGVMWAFGRCYTWLLLLQGLYPSFSRFMRSSFVSVSTSSINPLHSFLLSTYLTRYAVVGAMKLMNPSLFQLTNFMLLAGFAECLCLSRRHQGTPVRGYELAFKLSLSSASHLHRPNARRLHGARWRAQTSEHIQTHRKVHHPHFLWLPASGPCSSRARHPLWHRQHRMESCGDHPLWHHEGSPYPQKGGIFILPRCTCPKPAGDLLHAVQPLVHRRCHSLHTHSLPPHLPVNSPRSADRR